MLFTQGWKILNAGTKSENCTSLRETSLKWLWETHKGIFSPSPCPGIPSSLSHRGFLVVSPTQRLHATNLYCRDKWWLWWSYCSSHGYNMIQWLKIGTKPYKTGIIISFLNQRVTKLSNSTSVLLMGFLTSLNLNTKFSQRIPRSLGCIEVRLPCHSGTSSAYKCEW